VAVATLVSVLLPERRPAGPATQLLWTLATLAALALCALEFMLRDELMLATVNFLLFLLVNKLYNRRSSRDDLQLYAVTFMMLVAGSVLNLGLSFAACFVVYVVSTTWGLILFHLRREMEENYLIKHSSDQASERVAVDRILNSRRVVGGMFLLGTSVASLTVFALAIAFFLFFPRVGTGLSLGARQSGSPLTGFSDRISLGGHGVLRDNPTVVMRVFLRGHGALQARRGLYFRGMAFDTYAAGRWSRSDRAPGSAAGRLGALVNLDLVRLPGRPAALATRLDGALEQEIFLEPIGTNLLFAAAQPLAVAPRGQAGDLRLRIGGGGEIRTAYSPEGVRYLAYSELRRPTPAELRALPERPVPPEIASHYLGVSPELPPEFHRLAARILHPARTRVDRVEAVLAHLRSGYRYTRRLADPGSVEPLWYFLTRSRAGHCEYFASAMVLLLRAGGVPARVVTGFYGGAYNRFGDYLMVRQGDAHAWVEVWYPQVGWLPYDPTPPAGREPAVASGAWQRLLLWWDSLRMRWQRWVIQYDLGRQTRLFEGVRRRALGSREAAGRTAGGVPRWVWGVLVSGLVGLGLALWLRRRSRREAGRAGAPGDRKSRPPRRAIAHLLRVLSRQGFLRAPGQTLLELASRVEAAHPRVAVVPLVHRLYALRYSGQPTGSDEVASVVRAVDDLGRSLSEARA
jgi:protein-glutamine gamma-glutamyltransferase